MSGAVQVAPTPRRRLAVVGAGAWGTALAARVARNGHPVCLWGRDRTALERIARTRENARYLPGMVLPELLVVSADLEAALAQASDVMLAVPSAAFHQTLDSIAPLLGPDTAIAWACKGFERGSGRLLSAVVAERFGAHCRMAVISGPTFAAEVARGLPTAVTVAAASVAYAEHVRGYLHDAAFRVYTTDDLVGVQVGGAVKNVLAVAVGISDGLGFGANTRAALIARGLQEMMRLGEAMGGWRETLMGLSGLGDLVLSCTDDQSRNRRFGLLLGRGSDPDCAAARLGALAEGVGTALEVERLAQDLELDLPIMTEVAGVLQRRRTPRDAVQRLLTRAPRSEG